MKRYFPKITLNFFALNQFFYRFKSVVFFLAVSSVSLPLTAAENIKLATIKAQPLTKSFQRTGILAFKRTVNLSFKSRGFLAKLKVDEGDLFLNNQLLAALDIVELKAKKNAAYAQLRQAKNEVERITTLLVKSLSSEQALEQMKTTVETSRAVYKIAYYNLEKAEIRSSFTGVVLKRHSELGELQSPERAILEVAALDNNIVVKVALTGKEASQVVLGQQVNVVLQNNDNVSAVINKISVVADPKSHLFNVEVLLPTIVFNNGAIAGQLAEVFFEVSTNDLAYQIPIEALVAVNANGQALLMIQSKVGDKIKQQAFTILKLDNQYLYVLATKNNNDSLQIITHGWQQQTLVYSAIEQLNK